MSIIERSNPLNLQYRVCLVTSASSTLGVIVCKTLLKANALVLGIDSRPKDPSLNAGLGTHFQFERCNVNEKGTAERIIEAAREKFDTERLDVLVNIAEEGKEEDLDGLRSLAEACGAVMAGAGQGVLVNVLADVKGVEDTEAKPVIDFTEGIASQRSQNGIRCNAVMLQGTGSEHDKLSTKAYEAAKGHMTALMKTEKISKDVPTTSASKQVASKLYDIANLTLFLAGDMSENIAGSLVRLDGSHGVL